MNFIKNFFIFLLMLTGIESRNNFFQRKLCTSEAVMECDHCKTMIGSTESILFEDTTKEYIKNSCNELPEKYISMCDFLIDKEYPIIVDLIKTKYPPDIICKKLKLCV